jgi:hypothetical protein
MVFTKYLKNWGVTGNYTYTHSRITTTKRIYGRDANGNIVVADVFNHCIRKVSHCGLSRGLCLPRWSIDPSTAQEDMLHMLADDAFADVTFEVEGARITAHLAMAEPRRVRSALLGGLGIHLVKGVGLPMGIADAMEAPSLADLHDPMQRQFRAFAEQTQSDLKALAACIRGSRQTLSETDLAAIRVPVQVAVGTRDTVAGDGPALAALLARSHTLRSIAAPYPTPIALPSSSPCCRHSDPLVYLRLPNSLNGFL